MIIDGSSTATPTTMNFVADRAMKAESTLAGLLSKAFIADAAKVVTPSFSNVVTEQLENLKADLLKGLPYSQISVIIPSYLTVLYAGGPNSPYDTKAGKAIAAMITPARADALYSLLPVGTISKTNFHTDIGLLKTGLRDGQGFAELQQIL